MGPAAGDLGRDERGRGERLPGPAPGCGVLLVWGCGPPPRGPLPPRAPGLGGLEGLRA